LEKLTAKSALKKLKGLNASSEMYRSLSIAKSSIVLPIST